MKKLMVLAAALVLAAGSAFAQNYMVVNMETVFKSVAAYNNAVTEIDRLAQQYQTNIDSAYEKIEEMYNTYMSRKNTLSSSEQQRQEETILANEKKVVEYQESVFGEEGIIAKRTSEKLEPLQKSIMETVTKYAKDNRFGLVLDISTNPMVVYYDPALDMTQQIISLLK